MRKPKNCHFCGKEADLCLEGKTGYLSICFGCIKRAIGNLL